MISTLSTFKAWTIVLVATCFLFLPALSSSTELRHGTLSVQQSNMTSGTAAPQTLPAVYRISTVGGMASIQDGHLGTQTTISKPSRLMFTPDGKYLYFSTPNQIKRIDMSTQIVSTIAGSKYSEKGFVGENTPANECRLSCDPCSFHVNSKLEVFIADTDNHRIRKVTQQGTIITVAGNGFKNISTNATLPALRSPLDSPRDLVVNEQNGDIYFVEANHVRRVDLLNKLSSLRFDLVAMGFPSNTEFIYKPHDLKIFNNSLYFIIPHIHVRGGNINLIPHVLSKAVNLSLAISGNKGSDVHTVIDEPSDVNSFVYESTGYEPLFSYSHFSDLSLIVQRFVVEYNMTNKTTGVISLHRKYDLRNIGGEYTGQVKDNLKSNETVFGGTVDITLHPQTGDLYVADNTNNLIRKLDRSKQIVSTVVGITNRHGPDNVLSTKTELYPTQLTLNSNNEIYFTEASLNRVRRIGQDGIVKTVVGFGENRFHGANETEIVPGTSRSLYGPSGLAFRKTAAGVDGDDELLISDTNFCTVRKYTPSNALLRTAFGTLSCTIRYSDTPDTTPTEDLGYILSLSHHKEDLYMYDHGFKSIRKRRQNSNVIEHVAATAGIVWALSVSSVSGDIYYADTSNHRIQRISASSGVTTTVAGSGIAGNNGYSQSALKTHLNSPLGVFVSHLDEVFFSDTGNHRVFKLTQNGTLELVAGGTNSIEFNGFESENATEISLNRPSSIAVSTSTNEIFFTDSTGTLIRKVSPYCTEKGYVMSNTSMECLLTCFGKAFDDKSVCSGNGHCSNVDTCQCGLGYSGPVCEFSSSDMQWLPLLALLAIVPSLIVAFASIGGISYCVWKRRKKEKNAHPAKSNDIELKDV